MGWLSFGPFVETEMVRQGAKTQICRVAAFGAVRRVIVGRGADGSKAAEFGASEFDECRMNLLTA
jgi:hypothetical protein